MTIKEVREVLGVPKGLRVAQFLWNRFEAHDYTDFFYMPDDVFIEIIKEKEDFAQTYNRIRKK